MHDKRIHIIILYSEYNFYNFTNIPNLDPPQGFFFKIFYKLSKLQTDVYVIIPKIDPTMHSQEEIRFLPNFRLFFLNREKNIIH